MLARQWRGFFLLMCVSLSLTHAYANSCQDKVAFLRLELKSVSSSLMSCQRQLNKTPSSDSRANLHRQSREIERLQKKLRTCYAQYKKAEKDLHRNIELCEAPELRQSLFSLRRDFKQLKDENFKLSIVQGDYARYRTDTQTWLVNAIYNVENALNERYQTRAQTMGFESPERVGFNHQAYDRGSVQSLAGFLEQASINNYHRGYEDGKRETLSQSIAQWVINTALGMPTLVSQLHREYGWLFWVCLFIISLFIVLFYFSIKQLLLNRQHQQRLKEQRIADEIARRNVFYQDAMAQNFDHFWNEVVEANIDVLSAKKAETVIEQERYNELVAEMRRNLESRFKTIKADYDNNR